MSIVKNLVVNYPQFNLQIDQFEILDKGVTALWGPSGSGKSTIVRLLCGLDICPEMSWSVNGVELAKLTAPERNLGVVFQSFELFPHLTVFENIHFALQARKKGFFSLFRAGEEDINKVNMWIHKLDLSRVAQTKAWHISGGEKQRTALARALICKPRLLLLDEPFSSLDQGLRESSRELVKSVLQEQQIPALLITHDEQDLKSLATKIYKIKNGRLVS